MRKRTTQLVLTIIAFFVVHGWLGLLILKLQRYASGDLGLYHSWVSEGAATGHWPGLQTTWVYPQAALVPMRAAGILTSSTGSAHTTAYLVGWWLLVSLLNIVACVVVVVHFGWQKAKIGIWTWLAFLMILGPISLSRIDASAVPLMVIGLTLAASRPWLASALLTFGAWIKISPAAIVIAMFAVLKKRVRSVVVPAAVVTAAVIAVYAIWSSSSGSLTGFLTNQGSREMQAESVFAIPAIIVRLFQHMSTAVWNGDIISFEVPGTYANILGMAATALLPVALIYVAILAYKARRLQMRALVLASYCLVYAMIIFNKVGSPQFESWVAPALIVGLILGEDKRVWRRLAIFSLIAAGLTQIVYPGGYAPFIGGSVFFVGVEILRDAAVVAGFSYGTWNLWNFATQKITVSSVESAI